MNEDQRTTGAGPVFLTTKEVADLLRVKERKVYDLAAADDIPHRRITGKLLFPRDAILDWIAGGPQREEDRPPVLAGSHDPLLDWAVRESGSGLATLFDGSSSGLAAFTERRAALAGLHLPDEQGWNLRAVRDQRITGAVLIGWAVRTRGLLLAPHLNGHVASITDLPGHRIATRQTGAGAEAFFETLLLQAGLTREALTIAESRARTESDAAAMISTGEADVALGIKAMADRFHLAFVPLVQENFDLLIDRRAYFSNPVQRLLNFVRTERFHEKVQSMGGYDMTALGAVRWLSP